MAANFVVPQQHKKDRQKFLELGIRPDEGVRALDHILANPVAQVLVVTVDLAPMSEQMRIFTSPSTNESPRPEKKLGIEPSIAEQTGRHDRPELSTQYAPPSNEKEQALVDIWTELLGVRSIGIHDNFFDLGGHSLLATRVLSRVEERFQVRLPLRTIFEAPTVAEFSDRLQTVEWAMQPVAVSDDGESREEIEL
jgi:acyl carrier protein